MTKQIIDKHFTENINYYKKICRSYYPNYLAEDLLQEAYLKYVNIPAVNLISKDVAYLKHIGKKVIARLFQGRRVCKVREGHNTSPLFEVNYSNIDVDFVFYSTATSDFYNGENNQIEKIMNDRESALISNSDLLLTEKTEQDKQIDLVTNDILNGLSEKDFNTGVFVMAQIEPIYIMSKRTGISRTYLTKANNAKKEQLKQLITK